MVLLNVKRDGNVVCLFQTDLKSTVDQVLAKLVAVHNGRLKVLRICSELESLAAHGVEAAPEVKGLLEDQIKELKNKKLMTEEARAEGHVKLGVYLSWASAAGGYWVPFVIMSLYAMVELFNVGTKWWLTYWSSQ